MTPIACIISGSMAYGTNVPGSDLDIKGVHIPSAAAIAMQRVAPSERVPGADHESHALHRFMEMASEGQPIVIEMMFAPPGLWAAEPKQAWLDLIGARDRILTSQTTFRRYADRQASAFRGKGTRLATLQALRDVLQAAWDAHGPEEKLALAECPLAALEPLGVGIIIQAGGNQRLLQVGDKRVPLGATLRQAASVVDTAIARYGARALRATAGGNVDWTALVHALRLAQEGMEYHLTGRITLPRDNASYLMAVRQGHVPLGEVEDAISEASGAYLAAEAVSILPPEPDRGWMDQFVYEQYGQAVADAFNSSPGPACGDGAAGFRP
jgi:hypothetical protein